MHGLIWAVSKVVNLLQFCMAARAILSWNPRFRYSQIMQFLENLTEPVIYPVRVAMDRLGFRSNIGLDIPFLVAFILLGMIPQLLYRILLPFM
ncbi:MAG: YggT family protein [Eubacteriales bacterium]|jgi:uncharacterized protein YggT (Ycf19 family)